MRSKQILLSIVFVVGLLLAIATRESSAQILDQDSILQRETFWDNRDWDWYKQNIPFFDSPDSDLNTTYYYRWELVTKHLTYGSPNSGYSFTEFIDRPFWSGAYGAISCPAGHQLYEVRWLRSPRIANDYTRYWLRTPGAQPRNYSTWLADSAVAIDRVHPNSEFLSDLLPDLDKNYQGWEARHFVPEVGLFWQTGHDDGMEFNIASRQTKDILRGAPSYRPSFNAYMWADAKAIAEIARKRGDLELANKYDEKATSIKSKFQKLLWDEKRNFFFPAFRDDEEKNGFTVKSLSRTYETGEFAGSPHGRELIGYVPWQFNLPDTKQGYEQAWKYLNDSEYFAAKFGPSTVERNDPQFLLQKSCCWWSGQSWPYATTQTLKALGNLLQHYDQTVIDREDYWKVLQTYSNSHRKDGKPYLAEALHPDTGSFDGHDGYNHSEHYFHSGFCDLIITGLVGIIPEDSDRLRIKPLAPESWDYFALDNLQYRGREIAIIWDRTGSRYHQGAGLSIYVAGKKIASRADLGELAAELPPLATKPATPIHTQPRRVNYAVNNDGDYYPRIKASYTGNGSSPFKLTDGNYWYHQNPPNRWQTLDSPNKMDWLELDLGTPRRVDSIWLYFLDDQNFILPPASFRILVERDGQWVELVEQARSPEKPEGRRPNRVRFEPEELRKIRIELTHRDNARSGLTEIEIWGEAEGEIESAPGPTGILSVRRKGEEFPKATASYTSPYDKVEFANDGKIIFDPTPNNRWTTYTSPSPKDWLELDFGKEFEFSRVELHIYDDRGGVQTPKKVVLESWNGSEWKEITEVKRDPEKLTGGIANSFRFPTQRASKVRAIFYHEGNAHSGVTEFEVWKE